jgi:hypothetical protein
MHATHPFLLTPVAPRQRPQCARLALHATHHILLIHATHHILAASTTCPTGSTTRFSTPASTSFQARAFLVQVLLLQFSLVKLNKLDFPVTYLDPHPIVLIHVAHRILPTHVAPHSTDLFKARRVPRPGRIFSDRGGAEILQNKRIFAQKSSRIH